MKKQRPKRSVAVNPGGEEMQTAPPPHHHPTHEFNSGILRLQSEGPDDELARCRPATATALFTDDQPSQKSPGQ